MSKKDYLKGACDTGIVVGTFALGFFGPLGLIGTIAVSSAAGGIYGGIRETLFNKDDEKFKKDCEQGRYNAANDDIKNFKDYQLYLTYKLIVDIADKKGINEKGINELLNLKNIGTEVQFVLINGKIDVNKKQFFNNKEINYGEVKEILRTIAPLMKATKNSDIAIEMVEIIRLENFKLQEKLIKFN